MYVNMGDCEMMYDITQGQKTNPTEKTQNKENVSRIYHQGE